MSYRRSLISFHSWKNRFILWAGALVVGGLSAIFAVGSDWVTAWHDELLAQFPYFALIVTPLGIMVVAWATRRLFPGAQGSGIPQAIAALQSTDPAFRTKVMSLRIVFGKLLLTMVGLFSGASIGREGPTVHISAAGMYWIGRFAKFPSHMMERGLIMAGGAAGIAAAFNTPVAGIIFAIEELARSFEERSSGVLLTAVVLSGVIAMGTMGNYSYFGSTDASLQNLQDWIAVPVCGVVGGLLGGTFSRLLITGAQQLRPAIRRWPLQVAAVCGILLVVIALASGDTTYGTGYAQAEAILTGHGSLPHSFPIAKMLATLVSYLSGVPGGIFSPSLAAGAGIGSELAPLIPSAPVAAVVILAMAAYFTGVVQTPITASVIVMEMINNHTMILPIMATAFIAMGASKIVCRTSVYHALAEEFTGSHAKPEPSQSAPPPSA